MDFLQQILANNLNLSAKDIIISMQGGNIDMPKSIENLKLEDIHRGFTKVNSSVTNRKSNSFILRVSGSVRYTFTDRTIDVRPGEIIFLPKGSSYSFCLLTGEPCEYVAVRFSAENYKTGPLVYSLEAFSDAEEFTNNMVELWKFGSPTDRYKCYSVFYSLLAYIENLEDIAYEDKKKINVINKKLQKHLPDHLFGKIAFGHLL